MRPGSTRLVALCLFFLSGVTALVYEILWARLLRDIVGSTTEATSAVVSAFMAGLMLGSLLLGRLGDRWKRPLALYGLCEVLVGASSLLATMVLDRAGLSLITSLGVGTGEGALQFIARFAVVFTVLLVPTSLMGMTLPVLSKLFLGRAETVGADLSGLSATNTFGAIVGSLLAGFLLLRVIGMHSSILLTACLNAAVGGCALLAARFSEARVRSPKEMRPGEPTPRPAAPERHGRAAVLVAMGLSGFASFGYEILWTRALSVSFGNSTYAFATLLTSFLIGIGLGGACMRVAAKRIRNAARVFALVQLAIGITAALSLLLLVRVFCTAQLQSVLGQNTSWLRVIFLRFGGALAVMCVPAFLIGTTFPLAGVLFVTDVSRASARVGRLAAVNTLGNALGALAPSLLLIPLIGITRGILVLCCTNLAAGLFFLTRGLRQTPAAAASRATSLAGARAASRAAAWAAAPVLGAALVAIIVLTPPFFRFPSDTEAPGDRILYYREGISATTMVYEKPDSGEKHMSVDGIYIGGTGGTEQKEELLAHMPKLFLQGPVDELTVGLGSGILAGESARHDEVRSIVCVEIADTVVQGAAYFDRENLGALRSPKLRIVLADGAQYLRGDAGRYDIISTDAKSRPTAQGNGTFFSLEYFTLVREHLSGQGIAIQWIPLHFPLETLKSALHSFVEVFPFAYLWYFSDTDLVLMGATRELPLDPTRLAGRLQAGGHAFDGLRSYGIDSAGGLLGGFVADRAVLLDVTRQTPVNSLEHPLIEFYPVRQYARPTNAIIAENLDFLLSLRNGPARMQNDAAARSFKAVTLCIQALRMAYGLSTDFERIDALLHEAVATAPEDNRVRYCASRYYIVRALRRMQLGQSGEARAYLEQARDIYPAGPDAWYLLGLIDDGERKGEAAVQDLIRATSLDAANLSFRQALVLSYSRQGELEKAKGELSVMEGIDPGNLFALTNIGLYLAEKKKAYPEALQYFRRALLVTPEDPALLGYLVWYTYRAGDPAEAARLIRGSGSYAKGDAIREQQRDIVLRAAKGR